MVKPGAFFFEPPSKLHHLLKPHDDFHKSVGNYFEFDELRVVCVVNVFLSGVLANIIVDGAHCGRPRFIRNAEWCTSLTLITSPPPSVLSTPPFTFHGRNQVETEIRWLLFIRNSPEILFANITVQIPNTQVLYYI